MPLQTNEGGAGIRIEPVGFFDTQEVSLKEIDAAVIEQATKFRATYGLKASDAIHAATAFLADVSEFWTADRDFLRCPKLKVELFDAV
jgi:predicted nucleic acid-binding protein